jgi:glycosyltransferase involved in cell wall biosynthesis
VRRIQPALIHGWRSLGNGYGTAAAWWCGVRHAIAGHRCPERGKSAAELALDRAVARRCDAIVVNSEVVKGSYVGCGLPEGKICVIPNGVAAANPPAVTRRQLLDRLGLPESSRLIGLVGPLYANKRMKDAIWAADLLKVIRDDVCLLIFGDGPHRPRLERFRRQAEICDKVRFLGDCPDVLDWLPHLDLLWSTSHCEGQSNAILEAMAAGLPVVASDIPGTRDLVVHGETGWLVRPGHRAGFARGALRVLDDPELARRWGEAGRRRATTEFGVESMVRRYAELYGRVLRGG